MTWWQDRRARRAAEKQMRAEQQRTRAVIDQALWLVAEINRLADQLEQYRKHQQHQQHQREGRTDAS